MKKILFMTAGSISLGFGIAGIFIPLLPTVPFLLLTALCYMKSSEKLYCRLISHKYLGGIIIDYKNHKTISQSTKFFSVSFLWISISISAFIFISLCWIRILLFCIAIGVTIHVLSYKTKYKK